MAASTIKLAGPIGSEENGQDYQDYHDYHDYQTGSEENDHDDQVGQTITMAVAEHAYNQDSKYLRIPSLLGIALLKKLTFEYDCSVLNWAVLDSGLRWS